MTSHSNIFEYNDEDPDYFPRPESVSLKFKIGYIYFSFCYLFFLELHFEVHFFENFLDCNIDKTKSLFIFFFLTVGTRPDRADSPTHHENASSFL